MVEQRSMLPPGVQNIPQAPDVILDWTVRGGSPGSRSSTEFGGSIPPRIGGGLQPGQVAYGSKMTAPAAPELEDAQADRLGKTSVQFSGDVYDPVPLEGEAAQPPPRQVGFAEGMLGGLVEAFTGVLPGDIRQPLVGLAQGIGQVADVPLELLTHVPINEMLGGENVKGAFDMVAMTPEKQQAMSTIESDPTHAEWYMSQYLRTHQGDYAAAKGLPQVMGMLIRPDATLLERAFALLGIPAQMVSRTMAGNFGRAEEVLANATHPALIELRDRYLRGDYGSVGSEEALDRFNDEITQAGFGWADDPFIGMVAEMVADPVIFAGFATGAAASVVRVGPIANRAAQIARIAGGSTDNIVMAAVKNATDRLAAGDLAAGKAFDLKTVDGTYRLAGELGEQLKGTPQWKSITDEADAALSPFDRAMNTTGVRQGIEAAARVSELANAPFSIFGRDGAAGVVLKRFTRNTAQGMFAAFDMPKVAAIYRAVPDSAALNESVGAALGYSQRSLLQGNLQRLVRFYRRDADGKFTNPANLPDTLSDPDAVLAQMRKVGNPAQAQQMESHVRRVKRDVVPDVGSRVGKEAQAEYARQMDRARDEYAMKLSHAAGITVSEARTALSKAGPDELAFVHYAHWGRTILDFEAARRADAIGGQQTVKMSAQQAIMPNAAQADLDGAAAALDAYSIITRATLVGDRELTMANARTLLDSIENAADEATAVRLAEDAIHQYEVLYQNIYEKVRITSDEVLLKQVKAILTDGIKNDRFVTVINEANLPANMQALRAELHARGEAYEFGIAPSREKRWQPIYGEDGALVGYYPWMDIRPTPEDVTNPTRFDVLRERLFTPIRGENIMQEARRSFTQEGAKRYGLSRATSMTLWESVRRAANAEMTTMRSFTPERFRAILDGTNISTFDRQRLGYRGLAELVARAMESDLALVGGTSKLTGNLKTRTSRHGNYMGRLAEGIYPAIRFNLNPVFLMQEFIEPYFFNALRGVKFGMKFTPEQIRFHSLIDEMNVASHLADGFESREFLMTGAQHARNIAGPNTPLAAAFDDMPMGKVGTPKLMNYYNLIRQEFGTLLHDALEKEYPGAWTRLQSHFNDLDKRSGGKGNLSHAEVAEQYLKHKGLYNPDNDWVSIHHYDGAVPDEFGRIRGINKSYLAKQFGYDSGLELRAGLLDPTDPLEEWGFRESLVEHGFSPEYAARAYAVAVGVEPDELYASVAQHYTNPVERDLAVGLMRDWHTIIANSKGISVEEYLAQKFTGPAVWLNSNAKLPYTAHPQRVFNDIYDEWGWEQFAPDSPEALRVRDRARELHVQTRRPDVRKDHVNAGNGLRAHIAAGGSAVDWVPEGKGKAKAGASVAGIDMDPAVSLKDFTARAEQVLGRQNVASAGDWYLYIPSMFTSLARNLTDETITDYATLMNQRMKSVPSIDLNDLDNVRDEVAARMMMAWSMTQSQTSPRDGIGYITKMMDRELRGRRPDQKGITKPELNRQLDRMLRDFEDSVTSAGAAAKLHDFTDGNLGLSQRTVMLADDGVSYVDSSQPVAGDVWALRASGFADEGFLRYAGRHMLRQQGYKGPISEAMEKQAMADVANQLGLKSVKDVAGGQPSTKQYEFITHKYNTIAQEWNASGYLMDERGGRAWEARDVQAVDWLRIQKQLGLDPDSHYGMVGKNIVDVEFEYRPSDHVPLRRGFDLSMLTPDHQDHVTRTVTADLVDIIEQETGVTVLRHQPGWGRTDGVVSANTSWSIIGAPEAIDDALDSLSLLTQNRDIVAVTYPGRLSDFSSSNVKGGRVWGIDFVPEGGADARTLEALRLWLGSQRGKEGFRWDGSMMAMTPRTLGESVRTLYDDLDGLDREMFTEQMVLPQSIVDTLESGKWATEMGLDPQRVTVARELFVTKRRKHDYDGDEARAEARITKEGAEGPAADAIWAEEMGRKLQADLTARGKDDVRQRVVGGHMATLRARADTAIRKSDPEAWARGRSRLGFVDGPDRSVGAAGTGGGNILTQYSPRGFRGAVAWDRGRTTAQRVATGATSGRRGTLYLKRGKADVTTVVHETFHFMADDLDPSAIKTIHNVFFASPEGQAFLKRGGVQPTGKNANNVLVREAEEWMAAAFEEYVATGVAPVGDPTIAAVFNQYAQMWQTLNPNKVAGQHIDPSIQGLFDSMTPEVHRGPAATFDVNEYRILEAARVALQRAEEEAFRVHYYKRGRTLLERTINHPYLGMYPASYMWGKVLPELMRFLVRKPFGVDAPFAGLAMVNHVWEAVQLELATDDSTIADLVESMPALTHFMQLMVPGTPWDIPVNAPAWTRRLAQNAWAGDEPNIGAAITDTVQYAFGPGRAPKDILAVAGDLQKSLQSAVQMATGTYVPLAERKRVEAEQADLRSRGLMPPEMPEPSRLQPGGVLQ